MMLNPHSHTQLNAKAIFARIVLVGSVMSTHWSSHRSNGPLLFFSYSSNFFQIKIIHKHCRLYFLSHTHADIHTTQIHIIYLANPIIHRQHVKSTPTASFRVSQRLFSHSFFCYSCKHVLQNINEIKVVVKAECANSNL